VIGPCGDRDFYCNEEKGRKGQPRVGDAMPAAGCEIRNQMLKGKIIAGHPNGIVAFFMRS